MDAELLRLPAEPTMLPGQPDDVPRTLRGPIPLEALRIVRSDGFERMFAFALLVRSGERRLKAGHANLIAEAARTMVRYLLPKVEALYRERGVTVVATADTIEALAAELAADMERSTKLRREVEFMMNSYRTIVFDEINTICGTPHSFNIGEIESTLATLNKWIDYIEHLKAVDRYEPLMGVHRIITTCLRIHAAVFGSFY